MADWLIKGLRITATIVGLSTVGGGVFYLQNSNNVKEQKSETPVDKDDDDAFELGVQVTAAGKKPISKPVLEECKKKWENKDWSWEKDKRCGNIYIASEEEKEFYESL